MATAVISTYRHHHTVVLFDCTAASQEPDNERDHTNNNEDDGSWISGRAREIEIVAQSSLDIGSQSNKKYPKYLKEFDASM